MAGGATPSRTTHPHARPLAVRSGASRPQLRGPTPPLLSVTPQLLNPRKMPGQFGVFIEGYY
jgi:hypothetical protein